MKNIIILLVVLFSYSQSLGQKTNARIVDFSELKKRPLVVVLHNIDEDYITKERARIAKIKKQSVRTRESLKFETRVSSRKNINSHIKELAPKYWHLNKEIIFMSGSEVEELRQRKSNKYTLLAVFDMQGQLPGRNYNGQYDITATPGKFSLPFAVYTRIEKSSVMSKSFATKEDYEFNFINTNTNFSITNGNEAVRKEEKLLRNEKEAGDFVFSKENIAINLKLIQDHILAVEKEGRKGYSFKDYAIASAKKNCSQLSGQSVHIQKAILAKKALDKPGDFFIAGEIAKSTASEIKDIILNQEDKIIAFPVTSKMVAPRFIYFKMAMNTKTGEILGVAGHNTTLINTNAFTIDDLNDLGKCK